MKKVFILFLFLLFVAFSSFAQIINTVAGTGGGGFGGDGGAATVAQLFNPQGITMDGAGNLYIADEENNRVRKITPDGIISTFAGNGDFDFSGDGGAATAAAIYNPADVAADNAGNIYIVDRTNNRIRKVNTSGIISTIAGNGSGGYSGDGAAATAAELDNPQGVAVDAAGNVYIADADNSVIRKVNTSGIISTVAGNNTAGAGYTGDGAAATSSELNMPYSVAVDAAGNLFIADFYNNRIRKVSTSGIITTIAGTGEYGYSGDDSAATLAKLAYPGAVKVDGAGNVFFTDQNNYVIRRISPSGIITSVAGNNTTTFSGDGGDATAAGMYWPWGIAIDALGEMYISEFGGDRIRKVYLPPILGPAIVCAGDTISLSDTALGGTWSINTPASIATIDTSGKVAGSSTGSAIVSYTFGTMTTITNIAVDSIPVPKITRLNNVCLTALQDTLAAIPAGGTWSLSNGNATNTGSVFAAVMPGLDTVIYTYTNTCGTGNDTGVIRIYTIGGCDSLEYTSQLTNANNDPVKIYPNPNNGSFTLTLPGTEAATVCIFNMLGDEIKRKVTGSGVKDVDINLNNIASGTYLVKVTAGTAIYRAKVVIW